MGEDLRLARGETRHLKTPVDLRQKSKSRGMIENVTQDGIDGIAEAGEGDGGLRGSYNSDDHQNLFPVAGAVTVGVVVVVLAALYLRYRRTR